jgi:hypothetical protein
MIPQVRSMELSTKIPFKFTDQDFHWYREKKRIDAPQTGTIDSTSESADKVSSLLEVVFPHPNEPDLIPVLQSYIHIIDEMLQINDVDSLTNTLEAFVAEKFLTIPGVEYVFLLLENDSIDIWTVINKLDREIREKIYDVEYDILDTIKDFEFDFHVICRNDRNIQELYPSNVTMMFQR